PVLNEMSHHIIKKLDSKMEMVVPTLFVTIAVASVAIGLCVFLVGQMRISSLTHYIPYPVIAGFLSGIGGVLIKDGVHMASAENLSLTMDSILYVLPAILFACCSHGADHFKVSPAVYLPILLVGSVIGFHLVALITGFSTASWEFDWSPVMLSHTPRWYSWVRIDWSLVQWSVLMSALGKGLPTLFVLGALKYSVLVRSLSFLFDREIPVDGEMQVIGMANVISGVVGCTGGCHYISAMGLLSTFNVHPRIPVIICSVLLFILWGVGLGSLVYVPKFIFGGLLLHIGVHFIMKYLLTSMRTLPGLECGIVVCVFLVFITVGTLQSVGLGLVLSSIHLVFQLNAVGCISQYDVLPPDGFSIQLQGYLCFATSKHLVHKIEKLWRAHHFTVLHLDFERVLAVDNSFLHSFRQIEAFAKRRSLHIQLDRMPEAMAPLFPQTINPKQLMDMATKQAMWIYYLEKQHNVQVQILLENYRLEHVARFMELRTLAKGTPFAPGLGRWWFICEGIGVVGTTEFGPGFVIEGSTMSAPFVASTPCSILHISQDAWRALQLQNPGLAIGLLEAVRLLPPYKMDSHFVALP
ncbi:Sulfate Permease (SulP) Family, partial [Thraustotheca clavata]